MNELKFTSDNF